MSKNELIGIIIPCLNEEGAIGICLKKAIKSINQHHLNAEIIVVDNGSTDNSIKIIESFLNQDSRIKLVDQKTKGYGSAYLAGINNSEGEYILMADGDDTYDFNQINEFISKLKDENLDLVIGNRFYKKNNLRDKMPFLNRWVGNPILSFITKVFFQIEINDIHCGIRAIKKSALEKINLNTPGMEFASEMIVKASKKKLSIAEIPANYNKRIGDSKLNPFFDGWRHLRFLFLHTPLYLFIIPGLILFFLGLILLLLIYFFQIPFFEINFYIHPIFIFSLMIIVGYELIFFGFFTKIYSVLHLDDEEGWFGNIFKFMNLEKAIVLSLGMILIGLIIFGTILFNWIVNDFTALDEIKNSVVALTIIVIGIQTFFSSFALSILSIKNQ